MKKNRKKRVHQIAATLVFRPSGWPPFPQMPRPNWTFPQIYATLPQMGSSGWPADLAPFPRYTPNVPGANPYTSGPIYGGYGPVWRAPW